MIDEEYTFRVLIRTPEISFWKYFSPKNGDLKECIRVYITRYGRESNSIDEDIVDYLLNTPFEELTYEEIK
tara:strand:- start:1570 stop:1782 length:213 start_codon:yes stop_codon:yes gene_type:complete